MAERDLDTGDGSGTQDRLGAALAAADGLDGYRNLPRSLAIVLFGLSGAAGAGAFFVINGLTLWQGMSDFVAGFLVSLAWVAIFPAWIVAFLVLVAGLAALGIRDLSGPFRSRLAGLALSPAELGQLVERLADGPWRHRRLFAGVAREFLDDGRVRR